MVCSRITKYKHERSDYNERCYTFINRQIVCGDLTNVESLIGVEGTVLLTVSFYV